MDDRRDVLAFAAALAALIAVLHGPALLGDRVLSPADVVLAQPGFGPADASYEPRNRLLMDPVLQFEPWLAYSRTMLRSGRLPLWNPHVGLGAPLLANGQSAVFDPFYMIAYLGTLPGAIAWMAAARLWVAGVGMFLLVRSWGLGRWGRWFAGLAYPCSGFVTLWLLYPVANVAVWMPWHVFATEALLGRPTRRRAAGLAIATALLLFGGHVQTAAHVLMASAVVVLVRVGSRGVGSAHPTVPPPSRSSAPDRTDRAQTLHRSIIASPALFGWHWWLAHQCSDSAGPDTGGQATSTTRRGPTVGGAHPARTVGPRAVAAWCGSVVLGVALAAIAVVPLGAYLARSPVWEDRRDEHAPPWRLERPRLFEAACTALPYLYGSQRRGQPNLAKALDADNLNESAGGFAGLATLLWLAPLGWSVARKTPQGRALALLAVVGACGAFRLPPVDPILRALPVLGVIDHRRLTLWVAFGLVGLGAIGVDRFASWRPSARWRAWGVCWGIGAALLTIVALSVPIAEPTLRAKAETHYLAVAEDSPDLDREEALALADRQVRNTLSFVPRYLGRSAALLGSLALLACWPGPIRWRRHAVVGFALLDLVATARGLNPAIRPEEYRPDAPLIAFLRREAPPPLRILGVGEVLPPNLLMRYGLNDLRNYDSIELTATIGWLSPSFEPGEGARADERTSRRPIVWSGVARAADRLRSLRCRRGGRRVAAAGRPLRSGRTDRPPLGRPLGSGRRPARRLMDGPGQRLSGPARPPRRSGRDRPADHLRPRLDGRHRWSTARASGAGEADPFLRVLVPPGVDRFTLAYAPPEFRVGAAITGLAAAVVIALAAAPSRGSREFVEVAGLAERGA